MPQNTAARTVVVPGDVGVGARLVHEFAARASSPVLGIPRTDRADELVDRLVDISSVTALVHVCAQDVERVDGALSSIDRNAWDAGCERVLRDALTALQASHALFSPAGSGRVVLVTTTAGVSGAPSAVPLVTAVEGIRSMAKSAARQWGAAGIAVNCVAIPLDVLSPPHAGLTAFLPPPPLADVSLHDVASAIEFLAGPESTGITGATVIVDGGSVMVP